MQFDLTKSSTPVSTRVPLFVFENIESNIEIENLPLCTSKLKETKVKNVMESTNSHIPKKTKKGKAEKPFIHCNKCGSAHAIHHMHDCHIVEKQSSKVCYAPA